MIIINFKMSQIYCNNSPQAGMIISKMKFSMKFIYNLQKINCKLTKVAMINKKIVMKIKSFQKFLKIIKQNNNKFNNQNKIKMNFKKINLKNNNYKKSSN